MQQINWADFVSDSLAQFVRESIEYLPNIAGAIALLLVGWLLAALLRAASSRLIGGVLSRLSRSQAIRRSLERSRLRQTVPRVTSSILYWVLLLFFAAAAIEKLNLQVVTDLVSNLAAYLPRVLLAVLVVFVGLAGGHLVRSAVSSAAASARVGYADLLGRVAQFMVLLVAVVVATDQIGIHSTFFMLVVSIVLGAAVGGAALAFGIGSKETVSNILASYYLQKTYRVGQEVRIAGLEGRILEITSTAVSLDAPVGRVLVPARKFSEEASVLLKGE